MMNRKQPSPSSGHLHNLHISRLISRLQAAEGKLNSVASKIANIKNELQAAEDLHHSVASEITYVKNELLLIQGTEGPASATHDSLDNQETTEEARHAFLTEDGFVIVFTDGACVNNGKTNAKAGIGVWFGSNHPLNISSPVKGRATNNTAEIQACIHAIKSAHANGVRKLKIKTDSEFVINSMTKWIYKWRTNNWKVSSGGDVKNKEDFVVLDDAIKLLEKIIWEQEGNEDADRLAKAGAELYKS